MPNKELLEKAIAHISKPEVVLGKEKLLNGDGSPCSATGHMGVLAGVNMAPDEYVNRYTLVENAYGITYVDGLAIYSANRSSNDSSRKAAVLAVLNDILNKD
jgi:hypothetical protein